MRGRGHEHVGRQRSPRIAQSVLPFVILRKINGGTKSEQGSRFIERILSVRETCRLQARSPLAYLTDALTASHHGQPAPSLLPAGP